MALQDSPRAGDPGDPPRFLANLGEDEIASILSYAETRRYTKGEVAIRRGDSDRSLFIVKAGTFEIVVPTPDGPRQVGTVGPGDTVGDLAFFDGEPRSADVRALGESEALIMTLAGFDRLRAERPGLAVGFLLELGRMLSVRFRLVSRRPPPGQP